jgi:hypothetical protein
MDCQEMIQQLRHCERMKTLTDQTATSSTFAAMAFCISAFLGGNPLLGLPLTAVAAALFAVVAYATWRSHERYVDKSRSIEMRLANATSRDLSTPQGAFSDAAQAHAGRIMPQRSTLLH